MQFTIAMKPQNRFPAVIRLGRKKIRRGGGSEIASFRQALEVFPELGMLLDQLLFGHRQLVAQQEVLERILVQDVVDVDRIALHIQIKPTVTRPQPVKLLLASVETPERFARVGQLLRPQPAIRLEGSELRQFVEPVQLAHRLLGKCDLIHGCSLSAHEMTFVSARGACSRSALRICQQVTHETPRSKPLFPLGNAIPCSQAARSSRPGGTAQTTAGHTPSACGPTAPTTP